MTVAKSKNKKTEDYTPYSTWVGGIVENIKNLTDECLDRYKEDKKTNKEVLKMLCKLQTLVEDKYIKK